MSLAAPRYRAFYGHVPIPSPTPAPEPSKRRPPSARPLRWWSEILLLAVLYAAYSGIRLLGRGDIESALDSGRRILRLQESLHLVPERALNRLFTEHAWLGVPSDFAYASLHYLVTPAVLVWLWRRHSESYRAVRTWLTCSTVIGLAGFTLLPTAPPRLLESSYGFVDTMAQYASFGWWGGEASAPRGLSGFTNQYAAMPSLHVGWALWCGLVLWRYSRSPVVRAAGVLYPLVTVFVVMGTANHYLLDAVAGAAVMGLGALAARPAVRAAARISAAWDARRAPGAKAGEAGTGRAPRADRADRPAGTDRGRVVRRHEIPASRAPRPPDPAAESERDPEHDPGRGSEREREPDPAV